MFVICVAEIEAKHWTHDNNELDRSKVILVLTQILAQVKWEYYKLRNIKLLICAYEQS